MAKKRTIDTKSAKAKPPLKKSKKAKPPVMKVATREVVENSISMQTSEPLVTDRRVSFQPNDYIMVVHDNDPIYAGYGGCVISAAGLVQVSLCYEGKTIRRSYLPTQLMKIE